MDPVANKPLRFLAFSDDKEEKERADKLREAAEKIEKAIARDKSLNELVDYVPDSSSGPQDLTSDSRSLYDRLQEQKNKKLEAVEEAQKLANNFPTLDEEDVNYLHEVYKNKQEEEILKQLQRKDLLDERKRFQERLVEEEERKLKESLIGGLARDVSKSSSLKSKLSSVIKIKPKAKQSGGAEACTSATTSKGGSQGSGSNVSKSKRPDGAKEGSNSESDLKRQKMDEDSANESRQPDEGHPSDRNPAGFEPKRQQLMNCIGILPSLPIASRCPDSSDDSDASDRGALYETRISNLSSSQHRRH